MPVAKRHDGEIAMDEARMRGLLQAQFPGWADLPLVEWHEQGTDHTLFRLGDDMTVRMPIRPFTDAPLEEQQACREARWVPFLAPQLPIDLPAQLGLGEPTHNYPWHWSIVSWIEGDRIDDSNIDALTAAVELAGFVKALHEIDATDGPPAGKATWGRGTSLRPGAQVIRDAIARASKRLDTGPLLAAWEEALAAEEWDGPPVWFHGDLAGNLLVRDRRLAGVIDSPYGIGDPACDITPGWSLFTGEARQLYFDELGVDDAMKARARGWVLGPASFGLTYYADAPAMLDNQMRAIERALSD